MLLYPRMRIPTARPYHGRLRYDHEPGTLHARLFGLPVDIMIEGLHDFLLLGAICTMPRGLTTAL